VKLVAAAYLRPLALVSFWHRAGWRVIEQGTAMTDSKRHDESQDDRFTRRYTSRANAVVVRETDHMRTGIPATLHNVSTGGLALSIETELQLGEQIKIRLSNEIQRFNKEVRGTVRRVSPTDEATFFCGVELATRLTPLEVSYASKNVIAHPDSDGPLWM
jgi:hypothetical protein